jgi:hypothetical protein
VLIELLDPTAAGNLAIYLVICPCYTSKAHKRHFGKAGVARISALGGMTANGMDRLFPGQV